MVTESTLQFEAKFADVEPIPNNPLFSSCKIFVCYADENQNGSVLPKPSIEAAIPTIYNIPIVGRFSDDLDDFVDHGGKIEITGQGASKEIKYVHTTVPYGLVPESANITWETINDKEYLVIEGALLWTGRYPEVQAVIDEGRPQSMEIEVVSGKFNSKKQFVVNELVFSALCILGEDVEPAFEDAQIVAFSLKEDAFEKQFSAMKQDLQFSIKEGGSEVTKDTTKWNFSLTAQQLENELNLVLSSQQVTSDWGYSYSQYFLKDYLPDESKVIAMDVDNWYIVGMNFAVDGDVVTIDFDSAQRYKINYVPMELGSEPASSEGEAVSNDEFALKIKEHFTKMHEFAMQNGGKAVTDTQNFEANEPSTEPVVTEPVVEPATEPVADPVVEPVVTEPSTDPVVEPVVEPEVPVSAEFTELSRQFTELKEMFTAVQPELEQLRQFKAEKEAQERAEAENALFERFSAHLSDEEIATIREKASEFSLENLETQMFVLVGKKSSTFSKAPVKHENAANRMPVFESQGEALNSGKPYASLVARLGV